MKFQSAKVLALSSLAGMAMLALPGHLRAQAPPGPISPTPTNEESQPAAQPKPQEPPAPPATRDNLAGSWKLNSDESDDGREKMRTARSSNNGGYGGGGGGRGGGGGGVWGGGGGVGFPGGGGGGVYGRRGGGMNGDTESNEDRERMQELIDPPVRISLAFKDNEVDLADGDNNKRAFFTDGRKPKKSKDLTNEEIAAHWEQNRLVSDEKDSRGNKISRTFEPQPGGKKLVETVRIENNRQQSAVVIRYVYDLIPQTKS